MLPPAPPSVRWGPQGPSRAVEATLYTAYLQEAQLLVAGLLGWLWFGDVPDLAALAGAAIFVLLPTPVSAPKTITAPRRGPPRQARRGAAQRRWGALPST